MRRKRQRSTAGGYNGNGYTRLSGLLFGITFYLSIMNRNKAMILRNYLTCFDIVLEAFFKICCKKRMSIGGIDYKRGIKA